MREEIFSYVKVVSLNRETIGNICLQSLQRDWGAKIFLTLMTKKDETIVNALPTVATPDL